VQRKVFGPKRSSMEWECLRIGAEEGIRAKEEQHGVGMSEDRCRGRYWAKEGQVTGNWRRLLNEWLHVLYSAPNIMCAIKSRRKDGRGM